MTTLRVFVIILVVLNGLVALALGGWLGAPARQGEPERLTNQLNPERLQLMSESVAPVPSAAPAATTTEPAVPVAAEPAAPAVQEAAPPACIAFAGLGPEDARKLQSAVKSNGEIKLREVVNEVPSSWWVNVPPVGGREGADLRSAEIRRQGVNDLFIVQEAGANQYAISLGLFKGEAQAQRHLETLRAKGVKGVRVTPRSSPSHRIELRGPADQLPELASELATRYPSATRLGCQP